MMYKRFRSMEYASAPFLDLLDVNVDAIITEWEETPEDASTNRYCAEPIGAPLFFDHLGLFVQAVALYYWEDIEEGNDAR